MSKFIEVKANNLSFAMRKPIYGVGINDADYMSQIIVDGKPVRCKFYVKWKGMLSRCYNSATHRAQPTYKDCTVCDEWLLFSNFKSWMEKQDYKGKELDKDILVQGNRVYSPSTCIFVSKSINLLLLTDRSARGDCPIGVGFKNQYEKYFSYIKLDGKMKHIGYFDNPIDAHESYKLAKYAIIKDVAEKQAEPLRSALLNYKILR